MQPLATLRWLQLCSPQLPVGAFAYSQGLEQAAANGWIETSADLEEWLGGFLGHAIARTDLPLLARAWRTWSAPDTAPDVTLRHAHALSDEILALRESAELRQEERRLGSALARLLQHLQMPRSSSFIGSAQASYLVMLALAAVEWGIDEDSALSGYAFTWVQNQVNVACRLIPLGQLEAQALLGRVSERIPAIVRAAREMGDDDIGVSSPALALASAWHEQLYTRLFRS